MAPSRMSALRVILFSLTISGAHCRVMEISANGNATVCAPSSRFKTQIEGYKKDIVALFESSKSAATKIETLEALKNSIPSELKQKNCTSIDYKSMKAAGIEIKNAIDRVPTDVIKFRGYADTLMKNINDAIMYADISLLDSISISEDLSDSVESVLIPVDEEIKIYIIRRLNTLKKSTAKLECVLDTSSEDFDVAKIKIALTKLNTDIDSAIKNVPGTSASTADVIEVINAIVTDLNKIYEEIFDQSDSKTTNS